MALSFWDQYATDFDDTPNGDQEASLPDRSDTGSTASRGEDGHVTWIPPSMAHAMQKSGLYFRMNGYNALRNASIRIVTAIPTAANRLRVLLRRVCNCASLIAPYLPYRRFGSN
jgi:hypothetical protein